MFVLAFKAMLVTLSTEQYLDSQVLLRGLLVFLCSHVLRAPSLQLSHARSQRPDLQV